MLSMGNFLLLFGLAKRVYSAHKYNKQKENSMEVPHIDRSPRFRLTFVEPLCALWPPLERRDASQLADFSLCRVILFFLLRGLMEKQLPDHLFLVRRQSQLGRFVPERCAYFWPNIGISHLRDFLTCPWTNIGWIPHFLCEEFSPLSFAYNSTMNLINWPRDLKGNLTGWRYLPTFDLQISSPERLSGNRGNFRIVPQFVLNFLHYEKLVCVTSMMISTEKYA